VWIEMSRDVVTEKRSESEIALKGSRLTLSQTEIEANQALAKMKGGVNDANTSNYKKE